MSTRVRLSSTLLRQDPYDASDPPLQRHAAVVATSAVVVVASVLPITSRTSHRFRKGEREGLSPSQPSSSPDNYLFVESRSRHTLVTVFKARCTTGVSILGPAKLAAIIRKPRARVTHRTYRGWPGTERPDGARARAPPLSSKPPPPPTTTDLRASPSLSLSLTLRDSLVAASSREGALDTVPDSAHGRRQGFSRKGPRARFFSENYCYH